jgi:hypothetical protein
MNSMKSESAPIERESGGRIESTQIEIPHEIGKRTGESCAAAVIIGVLRSHDIPWHLVSCSAVVFRGPHSVFVHAVPWPHSVFVRVVPWPHSVLMRVIPWHRMAVHRSQSFSFAE